MSENQKARASQPLHAGVGTASIVMIFIVLCLTALCILSLSKATTNERKADKRIEYVEARYAAEAQAQKWLYTLNGYGECDFEVDGLSLLHVSAYADDSGVTIFNYQTRSVSDSEDESGDGLIEFDW